MKRAPIPNPGSFDAIARGCKCDRVTNQHGRGAGDTLGSPFYVVADSCTLHHAGWLRTTPPDAPAALTFVELPVPTKVAKRVRPSEASTKQRRCETCSIAIPRGCRKCGPCKAAVEAATNKRAQKQRDAKAQAKRAAARKVAA